MTDAIIADDLKRRDPAPSSWCESSPYRLLSRPSRTREKSSQDDTARVRIDRPDQPCGRDVLLPLLDHRDEGVRVVAAAGIWQSHPDLAIPLLEKIELCLITEAGPLAMTVRLFDGRKNPCGSDPRFPSLYEDEDGVYRWHEEAFQSEMLKRGLHRDEIARARRRT